MKRDLSFLAERMVNLLDENRAAIPAKQHGIKKARENGSTGKLFAAFFAAPTKAPWAAPWLKPAIVLLTASRSNASHVLREAAEFYNVDAAAITTTVTQEFASKEKAKTAKKATPKPPVKAQPKIARKSAAG